MKPSEIQIQEALNYDPIASLPKYRGGEVADFMTLFACLTHNQEKQELLKQAKDNSFVSSFDETLTMILSEGFTIVGEFPFAGKSYSGEPSPNERYLILWNPLGFLITLESYQENSGNTAKMYYNIQYDRETNYGKALSSYCPSDDGTVLAGDHDIREAFRHKLNGLKRFNILPVWKKQPFLWLLNYMDTKIEGYDYKKINAERIAQLPEYVQAAIRGS